jgi:hypothetical protein
VTPGEVFGVLGRVADVDAHGFVPAIGDRRKLRIERPPQLGDERGQGISKVLVFSATKTMPLHHDPIAEMTFIGIEGNEGGALRGVEQLFYDRVAARIEIARRPRPVDRLEPIPIHRRASLIES